MRLSIAAITLLCAVFLSGAVATDSDSNWEKIADKDQFATFVRRELGTSFVAYRGEGIIAAPVERVAETIFDVEHFRDWMPRNEDMHVLKKTSDFDWIVYDRVPVSFPFQDRDFVVHFNVAVDRVKKSVRLTETSIEDPAYPPNNNIVRGWLQKSVYDLAPDEGGKSTYIQVEVEFDPRGNLPKWLVKAFLRDSLRKTLMALREQTLRNVAPTNAKLSELLH